MLVVAAVTVTVNSAGIHAGAENADHILQAVPRKTQSSNGYVNSKAWLHGINRRDLFGLVVCLLGHYL